jgi:hypothetical protein
VSGPFSLVVGVVVQGALHPIANVGSVIGLPSCGGMKIFTLLICVLMLHELYFKFTVSEKGWEKALRLKPLVIFISI